MISSLDTQKEFEKIQHTFMLKVLDRSGIQDPFLNIIEAIYCKSITNIKLNGEILESASAKIRNKKWCTPSKYVFNRVFKVLARTIRQPKWIKRIQNWQRGIKGITLCRRCDSIHEWPQK